MSMPSPKIHALRFLATAALACLVALPAAGTALAASIPVTVTNTPGVTVTNTPNVTIGNSAAAPAMVDGGYAARRAQGASCSGTFDATGTATCTLGNVNAGQTYVIETLTCRASLPSPSAYQNYPLLLLVPQPTIGGGGGVYETDHTIVLAKTSSNGSNDYFAGTYALKVYAPGPASGSYAITVQGQGGGAASQVLGVSCTVSGYMTTN